MRELGARENIHFVQAHVFRLPFRPETFDMAYGQIVAQFEKSGGAESAGAKIGDKWPERMCGFAVSIDLDSQGARNSMGARKDSGTAAQTAKASSEAPMETSCWSTAVSRSSIPRTEKPISPSQIPRAVGQLSRTARSSTTERFGVGSSVPACPFELGPTPR